MNYRIIIADTRCAILQTEAAADRRDVFPTLAIARAELKHRAMEAIVKLRLHMREALSMRESELPLDEPQTGDPVRDAAE